MLASLFLTFILQGGQCRVAWIDEGNGKVVRSGEMTCAQARERKEMMEWQKPGLRVWVEAITSKRKKK